MIRIIAVLTLLASSSVQANLELIGTPTNIGSNGLQVHKYIDEEEDIVCYIVSSKRTGSSYLANSISCVKVMPTFPSRKR